MAQVGDEYLGMHDSEAAAKSAVEKKLGHRVVGPRGRQAGYRADAWVNCFQVVQGIFKNWYPADVAGAIQMRQQSPDFAWGSGILYFIALLGKETKFRELMVKEWRRLSKDDQMCLLRLVSSVIAEHHRAAEIVHAVCSRVATKMQNRTDADRDWWNMHIHRFVGYHAGWLPLLQQVQILKKTKTLKAKKTIMKVLMTKTLKAKKTIMKLKVPKTQTFKAKKTIMKVPKGKTSMKKATKKDRKKLDSPKSRRSSEFGGAVTGVSRGQFTYNGQLWYKIVPFSPRIHARRLLRMAQIFNIMRSQPSPHDLVSWVESVRSMQTQAAPHVAKTDSYKFLWAIRIYMLVELAASHRRLQFKPSFPMRRLAKGFPDQCQWINFLSRNLRITKVGDLLRKLKYKKPVEFLTMDLCICGDVALKQVTAAQIKKSTKIIKRTSKDRLIAAILTVVAVLVAVVVPIVRKATQYL